MIPCSVKCMVVMKVAIAELPPGEMVIIRSSFYPGSPVPASYGDGRESARVLPAAFDVGRHRVKGPGNPTVVRNQTALAVLSIRPMMVPDAASKALACASPYNGKSHKLP